MIFGITNISAGLIIENVGYGMRLVLSLLYGNFKISLGDLRRKGAVKLNMNVEYDGSNRNLYFTGPNDEKITRNNYDKNRLIRNNEGNYELIFENSDNLKISFKPITISFCLENIKIQNLFSDFTSYFPRYAAMCCSSHSINFTKSVFNPPNLTSKGLIFDSSKNDFYTSFCKKTQFGVKKFSRFVDPEFTLSWYV